MSDTTVSKYSLTEGGIIKKLLFVAIPIMGIQFMQMAYNLTDTFWLGRVGSDAVAASGAAGMYMWLSFGFILIGRMGAEIGVSQSLGRGDKKGALAFCQNSIFIAVLLGLLYGLAMIFLKNELIGFFKFRETVVAKDAADYLAIVGFGMPIVFVSAVVSGTFTASGNSRIPFIMNGVGLVLNVFLDPFFIMYLDMGIRGAAIATVIAQVISSACLIAALVFFKDRPFEKFSFKIRPDKEKLIQIFKWAIPISLESLFFCFLSMVTSRIEASFGANVVAVGRVGSQLESLTWLIGGGFGSALVAFIGQNYGAEKWDRIHRGVRISAIMMLIWGSLATVFLVTVGRKLFSLFLPDPALIALGWWYLRVLAFCQLPMTMEAVFAGAFKGMGRTIPPSLTSIICNILKPVFAYIFSRTSLGLYGIWIGVSLSDTLRGIIIFIWYMGS
ncbi:MAG: MATE family efflux transporter, partial [Treponema sp.]|nr:MATE family efflux transporter [Treponema sp.]